MTIRIGETHTVVPCAVLEPTSERDAMIRSAVLATEAVKRLVDAAQLQQELFGACPELIAALAPFTDTDASLVDSGLRSCATPETEETGI